MGRKREFYQKKKIVISSTKEEQNRKERKEKKEKKGKKEEKRKRERRIRKLKKKGKIILIGGEISRLPMCSLGLQLGHG